MNIKIELLKEHSKKQTMAVVKYIGDDKNRFDELMKLFLSDNYRVGQRAAWVVVFASEKHPHLIKPYFKTMLLNLDKPVHDAVKRNTLRILQNFAIPKSLHSLAIKQCFLMITPDQPIAVKVFAMTVLANIAKSHPELNNELAFQIERQLPFASPGFISRAKKVLKFIRID